jgi:hypothetical protein
MRIASLAALGCLIFVGCGDDPSSNSSNLAGSVSGSGAASAPTCQASQQLICHVPKGDPAAEQSICVGTAAVAAHLKHGDRVGPCCTPLTACPAGDNCGTVADGCGSTIDCGGCGTGQFCINNQCVTAGGAGCIGACNIDADCQDTCNPTTRPWCCDVATSMCFVSSNNQCCTPITACPAGQNCGSIADGCGGTLNCGTCAAPQTCGGGGTANQCGGSACAVYGQACTSSSQCCNNSTGVACALFNTECTGSNTAGCTCHFIVH